MNRYIMNYSQADNQDMVVYANSYAEALEIYENGEYVLEDVLEEDEDDYFISSDWT